MVVLNPESATMEVNSVQARKRKLLLDPSMEGKRIKYQSFPKATRQLGLSSVVSTLPTLDDDDLHSKTGHFSSRLEHWSDLNMTQGFGNLLRAVHKLSTNLFLVIHNRQKLASILLEFLAHGDELYLEPLYDLSLSLAMDLQSGYFEEFFADFCQAIGQSVLKIKSSSEVVQAAFSALSQIVRMLVRSQHETETKMSGVTILETVLDGLKSGDKKGLAPAHMHKLCATVLGQVVRKTNDKDSCVKMLMNKCEENKGYNPLAAQIMVHALKTTSTSLSVNSGDTWNLLLEAIEQQSDNNTTIWSHLVDALSDMPTNHLAPFLKSIVRMWNSEWGKNVAEKMAVAVKILQLGRGKKVKVDDDIVRLFVACLKTKIKEDEKEKIIGSMEKIMSIMSDVECSQTLDLLEATFSTQLLTVEEKIGIFRVLPEKKSFGAFALPRLVTLLMGHKDKNEGLHLMVGTMAAYVETKTSEQESLWETALTVEFPCKRPNDPSTLPNCLLKLVNQSLQLKLPENKVNLKQLLLCLSVVRPFDQAVAVDTLVCAVEKFKEEELAELLYLSMCVLATLLCPNELLVKIVNQHNLLGCMNEQTLSDDWSAKTLALIFSLTEGNAEWIQRQVMGSVRGQALIEDLLAKLGHGTRIHHLKSLQHIYSNIDALSEMMNVESISPSVDSYRERNNHLSNLAWDGITHNPASIQDGVFRFLLAQLSVNFSLIWPHCIQVVDTHAQGRNPEKLWEIFAPYFKQVNLMASETSSESQSGTNYGSHRNLLLQCLSSCGQLTRVAEKHNAFVCHEFLDVFLRCERQSSKGEGLHAFLTLFSKFSNLKSMSKFAEVNKVAEDTLGHYAEKNRLVSIEFFLAAHKELRQHKDLLLQLVDGKKWKRALMNIPKDFFPADSPTTSQAFETVSLLMMARLHQSAKDKRKVQLSSRKYIVRILFQVLGPEMGLKFLQKFAARQVPFLVSENCSLEMSSLKKIGMVYDVLMISAQSATAAGQYDEIFPLITRLVCCEGKLLQRAQKEEPLLLSKQRSKLLDHILNLFKSSSIEWQWSGEQQKDILAQAILPILQPDTQIKEEKKIYYMHKIATLLSCWTDNSQYNHWFFIPLNNNSTTVAEWACQSVLKSPWVEADFKSQLTSILSKLVVSNADEVISKEVVLPCLVDVCQDWIGSRKVSSTETSWRLKALALSNNIADADFLTDKLLQYIPRWQGDAQTAALSVLAALKKRQFGMQAYKLMSAMSNREGRNLTAQLLWEKLSAAELNDNLLMNGDYKHLFDFQSKATAEFLFMFHYGSSEILLSESEFAERNAAATCVRDIVHLAKTRMDPEAYHGLVQDHFLPVLTKGLSCKHDRVQCEFIHILTDCISDQKRLGQLQDLDHLQEDCGEDEVNFFDNMRHIQKHRRGRAMRRFAAKQVDGISAETCTKLVLPLVKTYLYNEDYLSQAEIVNSAIASIGAIASKLSWKEYSKLLQDYLGKCPTESWQQKQRVKVLAAILDSFHFTDTSTMSKVKSILERLLRKTIDSQDKTTESTTAVDLALYIPITKILILLPESELHTHVSSLIVTVSSGLRSRKFDERKLARDVLCEMSVLLGPPYLPHILSVLKAQLQRGYQLHVLVFTASALLTMLVDKTTSIDSGCIDLASKHILDMVCDELFNNLMEEKKVAALINKTAEAKKTVSFNMLEILACHMSKTMLAPVLEQLILASQKKDFEAGQKLRKAVKSLGQGLAKNDNLDKRDLLQIAYGILAQHLVPKCQGHVLKDLAFFLLQQAGNETLGLDDVKQFAPYLNQGMCDSDLATSGACLKFLAGITQSKQVVDFLLGQDPSLMGVVSKRCQLYQRMRMSNEQPYNLACQVLRNLISHNTEYQFDAEHLKAICVFFQGCLEQSPDDKCAMQLLGLVLFKFYGDQALEPFLKLLCKSALLARSEAAFEVAKTIISKVVHKHNDSFHPTFSFFAANIDMDHQQGLVRSTRMCSHLLRNGKGNVDSTVALFAHVAVLYFNADSADAKSAMGDLIKTICKVHSDLYHLDSKVHQLTMTWLQDQDKNPVKIAIGAKILGFQLDCQDKTGMALATTKSTLLSAIKDLVDQDDVSQKQAMGIHQGLDLCNKMIGSDNDKLMDIFLDTFKAQQVAFLLLHTCANVREVIKDILVQILDEILDDESRRKDKLVKWLPGQELKRVLDNLLELARVDVATDVVKLQSVLVRLYKVALQITDQYEDSLYAKILFKKIRSLFTYEKFNDPKEWTRRQLYYDVVKDVLELNDDLAAIVAKYVARDRNQNQLEDFVAPVQEKIEKLQRL